MLSLKPKDLVYDKSSHIKGEKRRKKAYFLTNEGISTAQEIKRNLLKSVVLVRRSDNELIQMKLASVNDHFKINLSLIELIKFISPKGIFDHKSAMEFEKKRELLEKSKTEKQKRVEGYPLKGPEKLKSLEFSNKVPKFKHFFGRRGELKKINGALKSETHKIIVVHGIAGIGKTTLISRLVEEHKNTKNIFWYPFGRWNAFRNVMTSLSEFLFKLKKRKISAYLRTGKKFDLGKFIDLIEIELNDLNAILVFDDFQRIDEKTNELFSSMVNVMERVSGTKIIVITRQLPDFYNRRDVKIKKLVAEFKLEGLDIDSSKKLLKVKDIDEDKIQSVYTTLQGHPLALELIDSLDTLEVKKDFNTFIEEEVLNELSDPEKILLSTASVYRYPVEAKAFFYEQEAGTIEGEKGIERGEEGTPGPDSNMDQEIVNYDTLSELLKRSLMQEYPDELYDTHDLIREFFYNRLTPRDLKMHHKFAADYYAEISDDFAVIEMLFHLIKAREYDNAANIALEVGHGLIYRGYVEFMNILEEFNSGNLKPELWKEILVLKGDAALRMGAFDSAIGYYEDDLELLSEKKEPKKIVEVYEKMGEAHGKKGEWDQTINLLKQSIELSQKQNDRKAVARAQNNLGLAYRNIGNYNEALRNYRKAIRLLDELNEDIGIGLTYINIGKINELKNNPDKARYHYDKSLSLFDNARYSPGLIKAHNALGDLHLKKNQWNRAITEYNESLYLTDDINDKGTIIKICANIGDCYYNLKRYVKALEYYNKSVKYIEDLIELQKSYKPYKTSRYRSIFKIKSLEKSEYEISRQKAIKIEYQGKQGKLYDKIGVVYRIQKNLDSAIDSHKKSRKIFMELKHNRDIAKININLGIDYQARGDLDNALNSYYRALKVLERLKEHVGMAVTYNNIGRIYELKGKRNKALGFYKKSLILSRKIKFGPGVKQANEAIRNISVKK
ncbi:MAG: tetratricopeptide repeat protein [Thermoplasmata archaeon]|nr:MAG: tetratricopeptide repeat protein [Thermoplasmata archaeon]